MAGKPKKMSQIKQILQMHKQGVGRKTIARDLNISKTTVKSYLEKYSSSKLSIETLLKMEDHTLGKVFHPGNPAYKDGRFENIKTNFDYFLAELKKVGVTKKLLWEEYWSMCREKNYLLILPGKNYHISIFLQVK